MSKYHPLDVRHPDNRDLLRKTYLLDPPSAITTAPSRAGPANRASNSSQAPRDDAHRGPSASPSASPSAPWGHQSDPTPPASPAPTSPVPATAPLSPPPTTQRSNRFGLIVALIIGYVVLSQSGLLQQLGGFARRLIDPTGG